MRSSILPDPSDKIFPPGAIPAEAPSWRLTLLFVALAATAVIVPMVFLGNASGHDFQFHLGSWMDVAGQWREGTIFPRWAEWANWGFGEPRFIFYPPVSWMIGAALGSLLPWAIAPGILIWLALLAAGMSMWRLAREWLPGPQAIVAAVLFAVNPYHLVTAYYRSDFAELLASALLPLVIWCALHVARGDWHRVPILGAVFACVWLSNAPAAVIATYSLGLVFIAECVIRRSFRPIFPGAVAMAAGFGLAAFYILPAAWERKWVQIAQAVADNFRPTGNFLFTRSSDPDFMLFNWKVSWVALGVMLVTAVAAIVVAKRRRVFSELFWVLITLGVASIVLMLPLSNSLWHGLPELQFLQFPWRWLEILDFVFALFCAMALSQTTRSWTKWLAGISLFALIAAAGAAMAHDAWWDSTGAPVMAEAIRTGRGYEGVDEYAPIGSDRYELPGDPDDSERTEGVSSAPAAPIALFDSESGEIVPAKDVRLQIRIWTAERREFTAETAEHIILAIRLINYPAWNVRVDDHKIRLDAAEDTGQMLIALPPGSHSVVIRFRRTRDRTAGGVISIVSGFTLLACAGIFQKRKHRTLGH